MIYCILAFSLKHSSHPGSLCDTHTHRGMSENEKQGTFLFHNRIPSGTPAARNVIKCHLSVRFGIVSQTSLLKSQQVNASGFKGFL